MKDPTLFIQGRSISESDLREIRELIAENPGWHRTRLSRELCVRWNWCNEAGRIKDMACRTLLLKLERQGLLSLPPRRASKYARRGAIPPVPHNCSPINEPLSCLTPLTIKPVFDGFEKQLFTFLLQRYHYLGYSGAVGENLKYMVSDRSDRIVGCLLFGAAAWSLAPRESVIGWTAKERTRNLSLIANNMRFLIPPWVTVFNLASTVLSRVARRISADWVARYGHPIYLLETFVDADRHGGCYRAANWQFVGHTTGRTRNGTAVAVVPKKAIYLYPLVPDYRRRLLENASTAATDSPQMPQPAPER